MNRHHRIVRRLNEIAKRRGGLTPAQRAIRSFHESMAAFAEAKGPALRLDEDERMRLCSACEFETADDEAKYCPRCGSELTTDEDDVERARTDEGRVIGRDDENRLGDDQPRYRGHSEPSIKARSFKGDEAQKEFHRSYTKKLRESFGVPRSAATGS